MGAGEHRSPGWETRWAIGSQKRLSAVWRNHDARSGSSTKRLAGTNVREVEHGDAASIVDRSGYRRAMFLFPFTAPDVAHEIRTIDGSPEPDPAADPSRAAVQFAESDAERINGR